IVAQHILQCIPRAHMLMTLKEWYRVLRIDGRLEVRTPDIRRITEGLYQYSVSPEMGISHEMVLSMLYGRQEHSCNVYYNGFTSEFLEGVLRGIGFRTFDYSTHEDYDLIITVGK